MLDMCFSVAAFCPFSRFCGMDSSLPSLQRQPRAAPDLLVHYIILQYSIVQYIIVHYTMLWYSIVMWQKSAGRVLWSRINAWGCFELCLAYTCTCTHTYVHTDLPPKSGRFGLCMYKQPNNENNKENNKQQHIHRNQQNNKHTEHINVHTS